VLVVVQTPSQLLAPWDCLYLEKRGIDCHLLLCHPEYRRKGQPEYGMTDSTRYTYYKNIFAKVPKPFAFVDLDVLDANARDICGRAGGKTIRLASKSVRCVAVLEHLLQHDQVHQGLLCFSAMEAVCLAERGFDDLVVAYPTIEAGAIRSVAEQVAARKNICLMVDSADQVTAIAALAERSRVVLPLCMDVDMSTRFPGLHFGVLRSPVDNVEASLLLYRVIQDSPSVRLDGVMGYEAQIAGVGDQVPGQGLKNRAIRLLKKLSLPQVQARRAAVIEALTAAGANLRFVNGGGTGSIATTVTEDHVTEVTVGSGYYSAHLFDYYRDFRYLPAAGFALEVSRIPKPGLITCLGGGYIASGPPSWHKLPQPWLPAGLKYQSNEGAGEVQTPLACTSGNLAIGDPVFFRHAKSGELCERFNQLWLVKDGKLAGSTLTYRGLGWCFL